MIVAKPHTPPLNRNLRIFDPNNGPDTLKGSRLKSYLQDPINWPSFTAARPRTVSEAAQQAGELANTFSSLSNAAEKHLECPLLYPHRIDEAAQQKNRMEILGEVVFRLQRLSETADLPKLSVDESIELLKALRGIWKALRENHSDYDCADHVQHGASNLREIFVNVAKALTEKLLERPDVFEKAPGELRALPACLQYIDYRPDNHWRPNRVYEPTKPAS